MHTINDKCIRMFQSEMWWLKIDESLIEGLEKIETRWEEFSYIDEDQESKSMQENKYLYFVDSVSLNNFRKKYETR